MSRRAFKPTAEQRGCVETMIGYGVPEAEICLLIKNPETDKPIDLETLRKHFAAEIATGAAKMKLLTSKFIFATILGHDGGLADEEARVRLALFYAKTRLGWNSVASCHEEVGDPTDAQAVQQKLSDELDLLALRLKRLADLPKPEREKMIRLQPSAKHRRMAPGHHVYDRLCGLGAASALSKNEFRPARRQRCELRATLSFLGQYVPRSGSSEPGPT
jgi:hypothetical protein